MGVTISKVEYYLPEKTLTNKDLENLFPGWSADKIEEKVGIKERHIVADNETALDLAFYASKKVLEEYNKDEIDFIILCTQSPDYFLPTSACILQERLGLRNSVGAFDYNLGCSGFVYGLAIAKGLITANIANKILLVTTETYSKYIHEKDRSNLSIFGDGAAATIIESCVQNKIFEFSLGTDGTGKDSLIVANGGAKTPKDFESHLYEYQEGSFTTKNNLFMNGPNIFNFTIKSIPVLVKNVLKENFMVIDDIDFFVFHQANNFMLNYLRKKIKIPKSKFFIDMLETGNTVSSTIPIALNNALVNGNIKQGDKVMLVGFGVGYSYGAVIIEI